jgi:hypothetical protein
MSGAFSSGHGRFGNARHIAVAKASQSIRLRIQNALAAPGFSISGN